MRPPTRQITDMKRASQRRSRFIGTAEAAEMLAISPTALREGKCGTRGLTRINPGGSRGKILFIRKEIEQLIESWIADAKTNRSG